MKRGRSPWLLFAGAALALGLARPARAQGRFKDVPPNHWAYNAVNELAALGILRGYPAAPQAARPAVQTPSVPSGSARARSPRRPSSRRRGRPLPIGPHRHSPV
jgi:hypothetical protein